jgi:hypothetical protein
VDGFFIKEISITKKDTIDGQKRTTSQLVFAALNNVVTDGSVENLILGI